MDDAHVKEFVHHVPVDPDRETLVKLCPRFGLGHRIVLALDDLIPYSGETLRVFDVGDSPDDVGVSGHPAKNGQKNFVELVEHQTVKTSTAVENDASDSDISNDINGSNSTDDDKDSDNNNDDSNDNLGGTAALDILTAADNDSRQQNGDEQGNNDDDEQQRPQQLHRIDNSYTRFSASRARIKHALDVRKIEWRLARLTGQLEDISEDDEQQPPEQQHSDDEDDFEEPEDDGEWLDMVLGHTPGRSSRATKTHQQQSDAEFLWGRLGAKSPTR